jgi:hypothetical protein
MENNEGGWGLFIIVSYDIIASHVLAWYLSLRFHYLRRLGVDLPERVCVPLQCKHSAIQVTPQFHTPLTGVNEPRWQMSQVAKLHCIALYQKNKFIVNPALNADSFWKFEHFWSCKLLSPFFSVKSCFFLRNEIDNPPSNFTGKTMQYISIKWYPETNTFVSYTGVNAKKSLQIATN